MQTKTVIRVAINVKKARPERNVVPEIMIPLPGEPVSVEFCRKIGLDFLIKYAILQKMQSFGDASK